MWRGGGEDFWEKQISQTRWLEGGESSAQNLEYSWMRGACAWGVCVCVLTGWRFQLNCPVKSRKKAEALIRRNQAGSAHWWPHKDSHQHEILFLTDGPTRKRQHTHTHTCAHTLYCSQLILHLTLNSLQQAKMALLLPSEPSVMVGKSTDMSAWRAPQRMLKDRTGNSEWDLQADYNDDTVCALMWWIDFTRLRGWGADLFVQLTSENRDKRVLSDYFNML